MTDALMAEAERLATVETRGQIYDTAYDAVRALPHALARWHTALTLSGWKPTDPAMQRAKTVFHEAYDAWDNVALKTTGEKIEAGARVIMDAIAEAVAEVKPERPSADMVKLARSYLLVANPRFHTFARYILRQAGEVA